MNYKNTFHKISFLQYPLMLISFYFYFKFIMSFMSGKGNWDELNTMLIIMGLSISLSTLQDTTKTQNKLSKKIWENPRKGKAFIIGLSTSILFTLVVGLLFFFKAQDSALKEVSIGLIVFAIGLIGLLKSAIEIFENHRLDKNEAS